MQTAETADRIADAFLKAFGGDLSSIPPATPQAISACKIVKVHKEKRLLTVITNLVTDTEGNPIVDHDGDVIKIDNLEDVFIKAFADGGLKKSGTMHQKRGGVDVVQHFTFSRDERIALGFGNGPELGIAKLRVNDDAIWADCKAGNYPEVSIEGDGERQEI